MEKLNKKLEDELNPLVKNFFAEVTGVAKFHLDSYNHFLEEGIRNIISRNNIVRSDVKPEVYLRYKHQTVHIGKASEITDCFMSERITPTKCRLSELTYTAPVYVDIEYVEPGGNVVLMKDKMIGKIPIMLKSRACFLQNLKEDELTEYVECPLDPGGYFIIKGNEKVLLIREELARNKIFIGRDKNGRVQATVVSRTLTIESAAVLELDDDIVYLNLSQFSTKVPIMVVIKAMGMESDSEIKQMVGPDDKYLALFESSVLESRPIKTRQAALEFLEEKVRKPKEEGGAMDILRKIFLCNIPVDGNNFRKKCIFVAVMVRRILEAHHNILEADSNKDKLDDLNYVGNRRLELPGDMLSLLFEDLFKEMNEEAKKFHDTRLKRHRKLDISTCIVSTKITNGLVLALSTGNWNIRRSRMHLKGMTQVIPRLSFIATLSSLRRILQQDEALGNVTGCRSLHLSQYGMFCPIETPQGDACGLVKHLALMSDITIHYEENPIISLCHDLGVQDVELLSGPYMQGSCIVFLNGSIIGTHHSPKKFTEQMRQWRRSGKLSFFLSIFFNEKQHCIYIASDGGRVCRPLIIADEGVSRMKAHHMESLMDGSLILKDFLQMGLIEYLDVDEENNTLIALCQEDATLETTHIEIEPFAILGLCAGLIPFVNHKSIKNSAAKEAMGNIAYNQLHRTDEQLNLLVYPQRPLLTTQTGILVGYDKLGGGENAVVAVMSCEGYNTNKAIVINKASIDRGLSRCMVMERLSTKFRTKIPKSGPPGKSSLVLQSLDDYGIPSPGQTLKRDDIYFHEQVRRKTTQETKAHRAQKYKGPEGQIAVVDRVVLTYNTEDKCLCLKLMTHQTRRPEVGDKFSRRDGEKAVCSAIIKQEDLPFSERGICPDLMLNAADSGSASMLLEILAGKAGASEAKLHSDKAYTEHGRENIQRIICETLVDKHGFSYSGKDLMYSGTSGSPMEVYIMMGPVYIQKSKHMVIDKMRARGKACERNMLTRQPYVKGEKGARLGEMERDCLVAYGASTLIHERLMVSADSFEVQVCNVCGLLGYFDYKLKTAVCSTCKSRENMSAVKMPYIFKLLLQELQSMNIVPRLKLTQA